MHIIKQANYQICIIEQLKARQTQILDWLSVHEKNNELPLYSSVDIRDAGFKAAVVDTNLFPAGFNNLCEHGLEDSVGFIRNAILNRVPHCRDILIIAEEHTRNVWYLENIRILAQIIQKAGFHVKIATFLFMQPVVCEEINYVELLSATGEPVRIHCLKTLLNQIASGQEHLDLIIMNNDLSTGIPDILKNARIPIYPAIQAGWHARQKSHHFFHTKELLDEFSGIVSMDPWFFSAIYSVVDDVNINEASDRNKMMQEASLLFQKIQKKYDEHKIEEKPYIFIKADSGTYGMAVMAVEDPQEIANLNRKGRNKLYKGKSSRVVERYLLQEGIPTIYNTENEASEVCIYQIENNLIGGFYRSHTEKSMRDNLNSVGMEFKKMCPHQKQYGDCGIHHDVNIFDVYRILARIAGIAAHREIVQLKKMAK